MEENKKISIDIKEGIRFHTINTNKFKTNLYSVFLTTPLDRESITKNALMTAIIRRGTKNMKSQDLISKKLEGLYGAEFNCGVEKIGDNNVIKFYVEAINEDFLINKDEDLLKECLDILFEIVFNPFVEDNKFKEEYFEGELNNLKQIIRGKKDNKSTYAVERTIEEMYKNQPYGLYKYGYEEDLGKITNEELYKHYKKIISECKIDIFASGDFNRDIATIIEQNENIKELNSRRPIYNIKGKQREKCFDREIVEKMDVTQGKLIIGLNMEDNIDDFNNISRVYNGILGGGANSKLFQNVREKASLAYYANSSYIKNKNIILIKCGIEIDNYEKAVKIIKEQIEDMKNGIFTDVDVENAKKLIISVIQNIPEEQDTEMIYFYNQEINGDSQTIKEYQDKIKRVSKQDIQKVAEEVKIDTIYFLRSND